MVRDRGECYQILIVRILRITRNGENILTEYIRWSVFHSIHNRLLQQNPPAYTIINNNFGGHPTTIHGGRRRRGNGKGKGGGDSPAAAPPSARVVFFGGAYISKWVSSLGLKQVFFCSKLFLARVVSKV